MIKYFFLNFIVYFKNSDKIKFIRVKILLFYLNNLIKIKIIILQQKNMSFHKHHTTNLDGYH